mmetsp:Transcript_38055/g.83434  ORF Transcript_38055/g.83434 Transcript_38055/m.83434 type:complete len:93 (-) Transcript_38055:1730-2008(-)
MRLSFLAVVISVSTAAVSASDNLRASTRTGYQTEASGSIVKTAREEMNELEKQIIADNSRFLRATVADRALHYDDAKPDSAIMEEVIASQRW